MQSSFVREWCRWMNQPDYFLDSTFRFDIRSAFASKDTKILAFGVSDDSLAPRENIEHLLSYYARANTEYKEIRPENHNIKAIGHNGFFRKAFRDTLWNEALQHFGAV